MPGAQNRPWNRQRHDNGACRRARTVILLGVLSLQAAAMEQRFSGDAIAYEVTAGESMAPQGRTRISPRAREQPPAMQTW